MRKTAVPQIDIDSLYICDADMPTLRGKSGKIITCSRELYHRTLKGKSLFSIAEFAQVIRENGFERRGGIRCYAGVLYMSDECKRSYMEKVNARIQEIWDNARSL